MHAGIQILYYSYVRYTLVSVCTKYEYTLYTSTSIHSTVLTSYSLYSYKYRSNCNRVECDSLYFVCYWYSKCVYSPLFSIEVINRRVVCTHQDSC